MYVCCSRCGLAFLLADSFKDEHDNEILFMSTEANYVKIRGGVPVVFPQFGPGELPQHGFARESDEWVCHLLDDFRS